MSSQDLRKVFFHYCNQQLQGGADLQSVQPTFIQELIPKFFQVLSSKTHSILQVFLSKQHLNLQVYKCLKVVQV